MQASTCGSSLPFYTSDHLSWERKCEEWVVDWLIDIQAFPVGVVSSGVKKLNSNTSLMRAKHDCVCSVLYAVVRYMHVHMYMYMYVWLMARYTYTYMYMYLHLRLSHKFSSRSVNLVTFSLAVERRHSSSFSGWATIVQRSSSWEKTEVWERKR